MTSTGEWKMPGVISKTGTHYVLQGSADWPLVVLIHGIGAYHFHFNDLAKSLVNARYRTLTFDLIGRGFSEPGSKYDAEEHVNQIKTLLWQLGLENTKHHVIGHSMGGALAVLHANTCPDKILSVVLLAPAGLMSGVIFSVMRGSPCIHGLLSNVLKSGQEKAWKQDFIGTDSETKALQESACLSLRTMHSNNTYAHEAFFQSVLHSPLSGLQPSVVQFSRSDFPVLIMWGDKDNVVPFHNLGRWSKALSGQGAKVHLETHVVKGMGHGFFIQRASETRDAVLKFLSENGGFKIGSKCVQE